MTLEQSLKHLTESFRRLFKYKKVSKNLIGFMRSTEVTVNKNDGSYNQHMHVIPQAGPTRPINLS